MTNTHITIGGHKVTTNKVGQVHTATKATGVTGTITWCVTNGICNLYWYNIETPSTGTDQLLTSDIPTPKISSPILSTPVSSMSGATFVGCCYVSSSGLYANKRQSSDFIGTISYPVADDWSE